MRGKATLITIACASAALVAGTALGHVRSQRNHFRVLLDGYQETPMTLSTPASGSLVLQIAPDGSSIGYALRYDGFLSNVTQAHIHLGRPATSGGIMVFLCSNLGNGPTGTPACPLVSGTVSGTLDAAAVVGPAGQGIAAGELAEVVDALRNHAAYGNVHTNAFQGGEIRGNIR
jgi:hypothetical protein